MTYAHMRGMDYPGSFGRHGGSPWDELERLALLAVRGEGSRAWDEVGRLALLATADPSYPRRDELCRLGLVRSPVACGCPGRYPHAIRPKDATDHAASTDVIDMTFE